MIKYTIGEPDNTLPTLISLEINDNGVDILANGILFAFLSSDGDLCLCRLTQKERQMLPGLLFDNDGCIEVFK